MRRTTLAAAAALLAGCLPLTFSHEAVIDFATYRSVGVEVEYETGCEIAAGMTRDRSVYLRGELTRESGFQQVFLLSEAPSALDVELRVSLCGRREVDFEAQTDKWQIDASFAAYDLHGGRSLLDQGEASATAEDPGEAIEDALDEVALRYLPSYRL